MEIMINVVLCLFLQPMDLKTLQAKFVSELRFLYQDNESKAMFSIAVAHYLKIDRAQFLLNKDTEIVPTDLITFEQVLAALKLQKPIQYIIGETNFYGLPFKVNPSVLIPRPETEELVAWILEKTNPQQVINVLDIGTGSGCIPIALKKHLFNSTVYAVDVSEAALKTAKENATLNQIAVTFIKADILQPDSVSLPSLALIVSNPPYVTENEKLDMLPNVLANEPHLALFVQNDNPLIFYEAIANFAIKNLENYGLLFFEINENLGKQAINLLIAKGFKNILLKQDMQGKDRMICCQKIS